jgi:hypothetical protein
MRRLQPEMVMTLRERDTNPGSEFPPTRPGFTTVVIVLAVVVVGLGIMGWSQISPHIHLAGIETTLGL